MIGRIKKIMEPGYGFIVTEEGEQFFFHISSFIGDWDKLKKDNPPNGTARDHVQFKAIEHRRGPRAINVEVIEDADV
jgi:cold shock CspA family protein